MTPERRNIIIAIVSFVVGTGLLILILNLVLKRPNQNNPQWGTIHIQLDGTTFSRHHLDTARAIIPELNRLGPTFVLENEINLNATDLNIIRVYNRDLSNGSLVYECTHKGIGRYLPGTGRIEVDTGCIHGDLEYQTTLMHEVGHALGMRHICRINENPRTNDICSPVGKGGAVMNPTLMLDRLDDITTNEVYTGQIPEFQIQSLDIQEFQRINSISSRTTLIH